MDVTNGFNAVFTLVAALAAWGVYFIYKQMGEDANVTNRAYLSVSPIPPGVVADPVAVNNLRTLRINVGIQNIGQTPADVLDTQVFTHFRPVVSPLPPLPPYGTPGPPIRTYLVRNEQFFQETTADVPESVWQGVIANPPTHNIWALGYIDYLDRFGRRHRTGFARRHLHGRPGQSLIFEIAPDYNYDWEINEDGSRKT
jgi:hypothetical protein